MSCYPSLSPLCIPFVDPFFFCIVAVYRAPRQPTPSLALWLSGLVERQDTKHKVEQTAVSAHPHTAHRDRYTLPFLFFFVVSSSFCTRTPAPTQARTADNTTSSTTPLPACVPLRATAIALVLCIGAGVCVRARLRVLSRLCSLVPLPSHTYRHTDLHKRKNNCSNERIERAPLVVCTAYRVRFTLSGAHSLGCDTPFFFCGVFPSALVARIFVPCFSGAPSLLVLVAQETRPPPPSPFRLPVPPFSVFSPLFCRCSAFASGGACRVSFLSLLVSRHLPLAPSVCFLFWLRACLCVCVECVCCCVSIVAYSHAVCVPLACYGASLFVREVPYPLYTTLCRFFFCSSLWCGVPYGNVSTARHLAPD